MLPSFNVMVISSSCSKDLMSFKGNLYSCLMLSLLKRLTRSDNITTFSTIMSKQFIHLLRC